MRSFTILISCLLACPIGAAAQAPTVDDALVLVGSADDDRARLLQITGEAGSSGALLRTSDASSTAAGLADSVAPGLRLVAPRIRTRWNSEVPRSLNEGSLWAGRGVAIQVIGGVAARFGPVRVIVAPEVSYSENAPFDLVAGESAERSRFSPPWRHGNHSADLPLRFGDGPFVVFDWGQSMIELAAEPVAVGFGTQEQWWGPGIRNALVMSDNAPGFPHAFVRTTRPLYSRLGAFEARWIVGGLTESLHFDTIDGNDVRALSGFVASFRPAFEPNLSIGFARTVMAPASGVKGIARRAFNGFGSSKPDERDVMSSVFARWILPRDGAEVYAEWAHREPFRSFRHFLEEPEQTQGYTLGLQWAPPLAAGSARRVRIQAEVTNLEQAEAGLPSTRSFYAGGNAPQGYTHRGRSLGAAIGPGSSSQWLAVDHISPSWSAGLAIGRIRWDNDAFYTRPTGSSFVAHDVSLYVGGRGTARGRWGEIAWELGRERRNNFLYQNPSTTFESVHAVDVTNWTAAISVTPGF